MLCIVLLCSCQTQIDKKELTLSRARANKEELETLLIHYPKDDPRNKAAEYLVENMANKFCYDGPSVKTYDAYFDSLKVFRERDGIVREGDKLKNCWKEISSKAVDIGIDSILRIYDCQNLNADYLIKHIDKAFEARQKTPIWADTSFSAFLEYVLPYRIGFEQLDSASAIFIERHGVSRDTAKTIRKFMRTFASQYHNGRNRFSRILEDYPYPLSMNQIERGHYGSCKSNAMYCTMALRYLGIPAAKDFVRAWGNKGSGHSWGVVLLNGGGIFPYDPFSRDSARFDYKPAKVFRSTYTINYELWEELEGEVPDCLFKEDAIDVTFQYGKAFDIEIPCDFPKTSKSHKYGLICVFDPSGWIPVWYGPIKNNKIHFSNMLGDVLYIAAVYDDNSVVPCSAPFFLNMDGKTEVLKSSDKDTCSLTLKRKYPRFRSTRSHARQLVGAVIEGSDTRDFKKPDTLYRQVKSPVDICDTSLISLKSYRYLRWKDEDAHIGNLAEIEFYGIIRGEKKESRLTGNFFGFPDLPETASHSYHKAIDGDPDSYFEKEPKSIGYVGIDLGAGKKARLTRIRFCPRSDTNFILIGDRYELLYWYHGEWLSAGTQKATADSLTFHGVPTQSLYWLRDLTKGKEERPFTYDNEKQIWW